MLRKSVCLCAGFGCIAVLGALFGIRAAQADCSLKCIETTHFTTQTGQGVPGGTDYRIKSGACKRHFFANTGESFASSQYSTKKYAVVFNISCVVDCYANGGHFGRLAQCNGGTLDEDEEFDMNCYTDCCNAYPCM